MPSQPRAQLTELQSLIRGIQVGFSSFYAKVLEPRKVSLAQFAVLICLAQEEPRKMSAIARSLHVSLPAVTHLVDRLQLKRMVVRRPDPRDRRVTMVAMTPLGRALVADTQGRTVRILTAAFSRRRAGEHQAILEFMAALRDGLEREITRTESDA